MCPEAWIPLEAGWVGRFAYEVTFRAPLAGSDCGGGALIRTGTEGTSNPHTGARGRRRERAPDVTLSVKWQASTRWTRDTDRLPGRARGGGGPNPPGRGRRRAAVVLAIIDASARTMTPMMPPCARYGGQGAGCTTDTPCQPTTRPPKNRSFPVDNTRMGRVSSPCGAKTPTASPEIADRCLSPEIAARIFAGKRLRGRTLVRSATPEFQS